MFECSECDEPGRGCGCRSRICGAQDRPGAVPRPRGHLQQPVGLREVAAEVPDGRWQVSTCGRRGQQTGEHPQPKEVRGLVSRHTRVDAVVTGS